MTEADKRNVIVMGRQSPPGNPIGASGNPILKKQFLRVNSSFQQCSLDRYIAVISGAADPLVNLLILEFYTFGWRFFIN